MAAMRTAEEVYRKYLSQLGVDEDGDPDAIALFTYALVEKDKFDWIEHHRAENGGASPTSVEIESWYASKPESYFDGRYYLALQWYRAFAINLLATDIQHERLMAVAEHIGGKLNFLPQVLINLAANFIFAILIGALAVYIFADFSPVTWVKTHLLNPVSH